MVRAILTYEAVVLEKSLLIKSPRGMLLFIARSRTVYFMQKASLARALASCCRSSSIL